MTIEDINFLSIGHISMDRVDGGHQVGGAATYGSICAHRLGRRVGVLSSLPVDFPFRALFDGIDLRASISPCFTEFENIYEGGARKQYLHSRAETIGVEAIPEAWKKTPIVLFGLIANEIEEALLDVFPESLSCLCLQGLLRTWDETGLVKRRALPDLSILSKVDVVCCSEEDLESDEALIKEYARHARLLLVTQGDQGVLAYQDGRVYESKAFPATIVDLTGAGDIFATAFVIYYSVERDLQAALAFANAAAACSIEGEGIHGIATTNPILERMTHTRRQ